MARKKIFIFAFVISLCTQSFAQILPSYPERSFNTLNDTTFAQFKPSMQASEGFIDPVEYIVGPGDDIFISISGIEERYFNLLINHEGFLYIPRVGVVDLRNKNLEDAKKIIHSKLNENFKNVDIYIGLGEVRKIKVSLVGNVNKRSTFILTSNSRLLDLIKSSSGFTKTSDFRNIKIISKDGSMRYCDYLAFLRLGDFKQNPYLKDGDVVIVDKVDKIVSVMGHIQYPATYEFKEGETIYDLINIAGGFTYKARKDSIELIRFDDEGIYQFSQYFSYDVIQNNPIELKFSDLIVVREYSTYYDEQWITIKGEVKFPGIYKIIKNKTTLKEIILEAGGFLDDASLINSTLFRTNADTSSDPEFERIKLIPRVDMTDDEYDYLKAKSRQRYGIVVVNFVSLFEHNKFNEDIIMRRGDIITIPEKKNYITVIGQVVNPGNIIFDNNLNVQDYIKLAGGFSWRAIESDVRIIKANTGEWIEEDDVKLLEPGDTIWILEDPPGPKFWDVFLTSLTILGQVAAIVAASVAVIIATR